MDDFGELLSILQQSARKTVEGVFATAKCLERLEELGFDFDSLGPELLWLKAVLPLYRRIAEGSVLPELLLTFAHNYPLLQKIVQLPIREQQRFARNEPVILANEDGSDFSVAPSSLERDQIQQLFHHGRIRDKGEQRRWLMLQDRKRNPPEAVGDYQIKNGKVVISKACTLTRKEILRILERLG